MREKFKALILRENFYCDLKLAIDYYEKKHKNNHRLFSMKLIVWLFRGQFRIYESDKQEKSMVEDINHVFSRDYKKADTSKLNIGFVMNGGIGDYLIQINYIYKFFNKYGIPLMNIDLFFARNEEVIESFVDFPFVNQKILTENRDIYHYGIHKSYDLFIDGLRYPVIKNKNINRINKLQPKLIDYILACEKYEMHNPRFKAGIEMDAQNGIFSLLENKKRIQHQDIYGIVGIGDTYEFPISYRLDEEQHLKFLGLNGKKYVVIVNDSDSRNGSEHSNKTWISHYYTDLINRIRDKYPDWVIVGMGCNTNTDEEIYDLSLIGITSIEEAKVLLKNAYLLISSEGGLVHLREAVHGGTSVVLFGPTEPKIYGYKGNINLRGNGCKYPCEGFITRKWSTICLNDCKKSCMWSLTPDIVMEAIDEYERR